MTNDNLDIVPGGDLDNAAISKTASIIHSSDGPFYNIMGHEHGELIRRIAQLIQTPTSDLGQTRCAFLGIDHNSDNLAGAYSAYPATQNLSRQVISIKTLIAGADNVLELMSRIKEFSRTVPPIDPDSYYLAKIAVAPAANRQGIGSALMQDFEDRARTEGHSLVSLHLHVDNVGALHFYRANGYAGNFDPGAQYAVLTKSL